MKALVVDDSIITRRILTHVLNTHQLPALEADNGIDALNLIEQEHDISLVTIDYSMPQMSGLQLIQRLRSQPQYDRLKLFLVTASDTDDIIKSARDIGADDFIIKPISRTLISNKLKLHGLN
ncbi:MAG: response regulator [Symploca sp. SIO2D2]|nr:response regulator [Symploca sp. SIO2D2]